MSRTIPCIAFGYDACPECEEIKHFYNLVLTPCKYDLHKKFNVYRDEKSIQSEEILNIMNNIDFVNIIQEIRKNQHECVNFNFTDMRFDVIEFLRNNNKIVIDKIMDINSLNFNVLEILYSLFSELYQNFTSTQRTIERIEYFWNWCEQENPKALLEFRNYFTSKTICHSILNCMNNKFKKVYYQKYINLWYEHYYGKDLPYISAPNETTDGETIIFLLIHNFMADELKALLSHETFNSYSYEWRVYEIFNKQSYSVPIICHILDQFSWARDKKTLKKIANIIKILIEFGKFNYDDYVIGTGNTVMDYLEHYGYNYKGSPVMEVFKNINLKPLTGVKINTVYKYDESIPYNMIWKKYEYTKDPEMAEDIFDEIIQEYNQTGVDYTDFLEKSNLHIIINRLSNVPSVVFDDDYQVVIEENKENKLPQIIIDNAYLEMLMGENPYGFINENNELVCDPMIVSDNRFNQVVVM